MDGWKEGLTDWVWSYGLSTMHLAGVLSLLFGWACVPDMAGETFLHELWVYRCQHAVHGLSIAAILGCDIDLLSNGKLLHSVQILPNFPVPFSWFLWSFFGKCIVLIKDIRMFEFKQKQMDA